MMVTKLISIKNVHDVSISKKSAQIWTSSDDYVELSHESAKEITEFFLQAWGVLVPEETKEEE